MAQFVLGEQDSISLQSSDGHEPDQDSVGIKDNDMEVDQDKRHYKKDSRYPAHYYDSSLNHFYKLPVTDT